ncbi:MAG: pyruvate dehydrogenase (acetyl-transferring) E1 component subunit alpha, partial [Chloroflexi bacterium]|nr:pyruvate dehydrogenase (acetyl-transferring) E1 component subunit alpha [Chloroflexota bacterium]
MAAQEKELTNEQLLEMYRKMLLVRTFEEKCAAEFAKGVM